jgi:hypothetical protein
VQGASPRGPLHRVTALRARSRPGRCRAPVEHQVRRIDITVHRRSGGQQRRRRRGKGGVVATTAATAVAAAATAPRPAAAAAARVGLAAAEQAELRAAGPAAARPPPRARPTRSPRARSPWTRRRRRARPPPVGMPEGSHGRRSSEAPVKKAPMSDTLPGAMVGCPLAYAGASGRVHDTVNEPSAATCADVTCESCCLSGGKNLLALRSSMRTTS